MITISYDKLFAYLYKNGISKSELSKRTGVSRNTIIKMTKNEIVHLSVILDICDQYKMKFDDVIELDYHRDSIEE